MKKISLELYRKMFLIRACEEKIRELYPSDIIKSPTHLALGEEAIAAGVITATGPQNEIYGTYRNHGIYLAKTGETDRFFSELFGKMSGLSKGKAGSMHIMAPDKDFMATSAIVGSTIPAAVGAAFANQYMGQHKTVVTFFGDGAIDEGAFWESLNFACLKKLPVVFVCEDNAYAIHTHKKDRHGYASISNIVSQFNCISIEHAGTDVEEIHVITSKALTQQKRHPKPIFLHFHYYRYLEHVGISYDFQFGYRSENEYKKWLKNDPVLLQKRRLILQGIEETEIKEIEQSIINQIQKSVQKALDAPFPDHNELLTDVFYE